jgi:membrane peptidoglycan carboxypeptidase
MIWHDFMIEAVKDVEPIPFTVAAPLLPSRAEAEAKARVVAEKRLSEREGFDIPPARTAEDLPPGGPLWAPAPKPNAKAPPSQARPTTSSTEPPSASQPKKDAPPPEQSSSTTTTSPPPERRPPPPRGPLPPVPIPGD